MASFKDGMPATAVYFVKPELIASMADFLIKSGVSKSGSPAASPIMSRPSDLSFKALAVMASVGDSSIRLTQADKAIFDKIFPNKVISKNFDFTQK